MPWVCASVLTAPAAGIIRPMIEIHVNGTARRFEQAMDVAELVRQLELSGKKIAVERNGDIVPKSLHAATRLTDGDRVEIVVAVGGG